MTWSEFRSKQRLECTVSNFEEWRDRLRRNPWADLPSTQQRLIRKVLAAVTKKR